MNKTFLISAIAIFISSVLIFTSCSHEYKSQEEVANEMLDKIVIYLETGDKNSLCKMFSENAKNSNSDFDEQIQNLINYFDGNVLQYKKIETTAGGESIRNGELVEQQITNAYCDNITTDKDSYILSFSAISIDKENPENEGLSRIWLGKNKDDYVIVDNL